MSTPDAPKVDTTDSSTPDSGAPGATNADLTVPSSSTAAAASSSTKPQESDKPEELLPKIKSVKKDGDKVCVLMNPEPPITAGGTRKYKRKGGKKSKKRSAKGRKSSRKSSKKTRGGSLEFANYKTGGSYANRPITGGRKRKGGKSKKQ
jgi:hypothetical protein